MSALITEFGRRDRAAIITRAQEYHRKGMEWSAALAWSNREASKELLSRFNRHSTVPLREAKRA